MYVYMQVQADVHSDKWLRALTGQVGLYMVHPPDGAGGPYHPSDTKWNAEGWSAQTLADLILVANRRESDLGNSFVMTVFTSHSPAVMQPYLEASGMRVSALYFVQVNL